MILFDLIHYIYTHCGSSRFKELNDILGFIEDREIRVEDDILLGVAF